MYASKGTEKDGIPKKLVGKYNTTGYCAGCNDPKGSRATSTGVAATPGVTLAVTKADQEQLVVVMGPYILLMDITIFYRIYVVQKGILISMFQIPIPVRMI